MSDAMELDTFDVDELIIRDGKEIVFPEIKDGVPVSPTGGGIVNIDDEDPENAVDTGRMYIIEEGAAIAFAKNKDVRMIGFMFVRVRRSY